jgi:glycosyltransferase involved in cell wall biosynthesis
MITHNHEPYVAQAIDSILAQQCDFEFELIIGEDCSQDRTREICEDYARSLPGRVQLVTSAANVGMHRNLARIWDRARGKYIALCEGDDYWTDLRKLAKQVAFLEGRPDYTLCGAYTHKIRQADGGQWEPAGRVGPPAVKECYGLEDLILDYSFHTSSVLLRKEVVRFPDWFQDQYCADRPLYLLCAEQGPVGFIPEVMSVYRLHGTGVWAPTALVDKAEKGRRLFQTLDAYFAQRYTRLVQRTLGGIIWSYMAEALAAGDLKTGRRLFWMAISHFVRAGRFGMVRHWLVALLRLYAPRLYAGAKRMERGRAA